MSRSYNFSPPKRLHGVSGITLPLPSLSCYVHNKTLHIRYYFYSLYGLLGMQSTFYQKQSRNMETVSNRKDALRLMN
jgi:hypothetical protein